MEYLPNNKYYTVFVVVIWSSDQ